ncbi:unnamed protein product [Heligmosomoides polygyrus]|uniref:EAL domain-containing protein n=1 Tax=Heligmosomoides polygyrus TaxID=6339 RepID=A0A183FQJ8_HELPZ|nr:unnamed protein product [Heligmosomoides polygyrus]
MALNLASAVEFELLQCELVQGEILQKEFLQRVRERCVDELHPQHELLPKVWLSSAADFPSRIYAVELVFPQLVVDVAFA